MIQSSDGSKRCYFHRILPWYKQFSLNLKLHFFYHGLYGKLFSCIWVFISKTVNSVVCVIIFLLRKNSELLESWFNLVLHFIFFRNYKLTRLLLSRSQSTKFQFEKSFVFEFFLFVGILLVRKSQRSAIRFESFWCSNSRLLVNTELVSCLEVSK